MQNIEASEKLIFLRNFVDTLEGGNMLLEKNNKVLGLGLLEFLKIRAFGFVFSFVFYFRAKGFLCGLLHITPFFFIRQCKIFYQRDYFVAFVAIIGFYFFMTNSIYIWLPFRVLWHVDMPFYLEYTHKVGNYISHVYYHVLRVMFEVV